MSYIAEPPETSFRAPCPCCGRVVAWKTWLTQAGSYGQTVYEIECSRTPDV